MTLRHEADSSLDAAPAVCLGCHPRRRSLCPPRVAAVARPQRPRRESAPFARSPVPPPRRVPRRRRRARQHCRFGPARTDARIRHLCRAALEVEPAALAASCLVSAFSRDERPAWFSAAAQLKLDAMQDRYRVPGAPATLCVLGELETFLCPTDSPACRRFASNVRLSTSQPASTLYVFARVRNTLPAWLTISLVLFPRPPRRPFNRLTDLLLRACYDAEHTLLVLC